MNYFGAKWTPTEDALIRSHYERTAKKLLLEHMPTRTWPAIRERARKLGCTGICPRGQNRYEVHGDIAVIFLEQRNGTTHHCHISSHRLNAVLAVGRWRINFVKGKPYVRSKSEPSHMLHRFIMGCPPDKEVDHIDDDGLNNVDANLRIATRSQNNQNKPTFSKNSASGYRNVGYNRSLRLWIAKLTINGKTIAKSAHTKEEAIVLAAALRREFHPFAARG